MPNRTPTMPRRIRTHQYCDSRPNIGCLPFSSSSVPYNSIPSRQFRCPPYTSGSVVVPIAIYEPRNRRTPALWFRGSAVQPNGDVETERPTIRGVQLQITLSLDVGRLLSGQARSGEMDGCAYASDIRATTYLSISHDADRSYEEDQCSL